MGLVLIGEEKNLEGVALPPFFELVAPNPDYLSAQQAVTEQGILRFISTQHPLLAFIRPEAFIIGRALSFTPSHYSIRRLLLRLTEEIYRYEIGKRVVMTYVVIDYQYAKAIRWTKGHVPDE